MFWVFFAGFNVDLFLLFYLRGILKLNFKKKSTIIVKTCPQKSNSPDPIQTAWKIHFHFFPPLKSFYSRAPSMGSKVWFIFNVTLINTATSQTLFFTCLASPSHVHLRVFRCFSWSFFFAAPKHLLVNFERQHREYFFNWDLFNYFTLLVAGLRDFFLFFFIIYWVFSRRDKKKMSG